MDIQNFLSQELTETEKRNMNGKEITSAIRSYLKQFFPKCKFSVTRETYSMGQSINVALVQAPFAVLTGEKAYIQVNEYRINNEDYETASSRYENPTCMTKEGYALMRDVCNLVNHFNYNNSDPMTDYYDVNFSAGITVGKWDKPFEVK